VPPLSRSVSRDRRIHYISGDASQENICRLLIEAAINKFGNLDMLVNNAGIGIESKKINEISTMGWRYVIDVNLKDAFLSTREALNHMLHNSDIPDSNT
jgi:NAD(P)-dependent dehydrogenase (short-subunit alcohol dehydrogenase family)